MIGPHALNVFLCVSALGQADAARIDLVRSPIAVEAGRERQWTVAAPAGRNSVHLEIKCRMNASSTAGSAFFLKVFWNGTEVRPSKRRDVRRLTNRPLISPVAPSLTAPWYGAGGWRVVYASDFDAPGRESFYHGDPCTLVFDVTDMTKLDGGNQIKIVNTAGTTQKVTAVSTGELVLGALAVRLESGHRTTAQTPSTVIGVEKPSAAAPGFSIEVHDGGGFSITLGTRKFDLMSSFSYPNAGWNKFVPARTPDRNGQHGWSCGKRKAGQSEVVFAAGPDYRIERRVRVTGRRVEVLDSITNAHGGAPLGLMLRHELSLPGKDVPPVRIAGNPDPEVNEYYSPGNPSVHVALPDCGIGLICEDDLFRNQARLYFADPMTGRPPVVGLRTDMLRLAPGETYTVRWSVYPLASSDYYDFINLVRADWGANTKVEGAWLWGYDPDAVLAMKDRELRDQFDRLGIRIAIVGGGWIDRTSNPRRIGFGAGVLDDYWKDYRRRIRESAVKIRRACPGARVLVYYNSQRDTSERGPERFRDSWLADSAGRLQSTDWNGRFNPAYSMVATMENSFGAAMLEVADRYMEELKADGLYWDEMESTRFGAPEIAYNLPDGHSCLIDVKTHTISREIGITPLLGESHRLAVIQRVRKKGGLILGNGPACTRSMLASGIQRMVEIQHNDVWSYEGNLQTPLGYLSTRKTAEDTVRALKQACLPVAQAYEGQAAARFFPFTPVELHPGYLLGRERIIAAHPGNYGWRDTRSLVRIDCFDRAGRPIDDRFETRIAREARTEVSLRPGEIVVLERLPMSLEPVAGEAVVSQVRYASSEIDLNVRCRSGATLRIGNSSVPLSETRRYAVTGDDLPEQFERPVNGVLSISIKPGFEGTIRARMVDESSGREVGGRVPEPGRNADRGRTGGDVRDHDRAGADDRPGADGSALDHSAAQAKQSALLDLAGPGDPSARSDMREVADFAVVIDAASGVQDRVPADGRTGLNHRAGEDDRAGADAGARSDV